MSVGKGKFVLNLIGYKEKIYSEIMHFKLYITMTHRCRAFQQKFTLANQTSPMARFL